MKVSVILTTYNRPAMLKKAVESVISQTYPDWELLVMDDASDMKEQHDVLDWIAQQKNCTVYLGEVPADRKATVRYATLINNALKKVTGELVTYLCDDDFYYPERLDTMVKHLQANPEHLIVYGKQKLFSLQPDGSLIDFPTPIRYVGDSVDRASCNVDHSSVMHFTYLADRVGGWNDDPRWWGEGDGAFFDRLNDAGYKFHGIPEILDAHVYHDGSWTKDGRWRSL